MIPRVACPPYNPNIYGMEAAGKSGIMLKTAEFLLIRRGKRGNEYGVKSAAGGEVVKTGGVAWNPNPSTNPGGILGGEILRFRFVLTLLFSAVLVLIFTEGALASTYTVAPGDSLYKIGQRFGVSVREIQAANGLGSTTSIRPGQQLSIPTGNTHIVQNGDSLFKIARSHGLTVNDIMRANGLGSSLIYPGQQLSIPTGNINVNSNIHTVQSGDSLFKIAKGYGVTVNDLMRENGLAGSTITPGQHLRIPSRTASVTNSRGLFISPRDFDALARLITSEADCQTHEVKVAVGAVVLNRVQSPLFPNNIYDVVYDRSGGKVQFEPVLNGWINRPATPAAIRAAQDALRGWDPSLGATFFFEPWVTNKFLHSLPVARKLGAFIFAYSG